MSKEDNTNNNSADKKREALRKLLREKMQQTLRAPASSAQKRLWFVNRLEEPNPSYNIPFYITLNGEIDISILEKALSEIAKRHAILRTTFEEEDGKPVQVVAPSVGLSLPVIDLSDKSGETLKQAVKQRISEEASVLFDLEKAPLLRACLLRLDHDEHILVFTMHHIISDGWSVSVIVQEIFRLYEAFKDGKESPLPALPLQYIDYSAREARWLGSDDYKKQLSYWQEKLAGISTLNLPTDKPRPLIKGYRGSTHSFTIDSKLSQQLKQLCESEGATLFMVMMSAFSILLHRYSGQDDIVFGSPTANRNRAELEELIGFFVNVLIMRSSFTENMTFRELLSQVTDTALSAYQNQELSFERLVEELQPDRDPRRSPLFQVVFALQNEPSAPASIDGLEIGQVIVPGYDASEYELNEAMTRQDLELHLWEGRTGIRGTWAYDSELFEASTIARMTENFISLLEGIIQNPACRITQIPLLSSRERQQLLVTWNQATADYPADSTVNQLFEAWSGKTPDAPALVFDQHELTYSELNARANQLARYIKQNNVEHETLVGVCLERSTDLITALLAIMKVGGAYLPLDPKYPRSRLDYMLQDADVAVVLTNETLAQQLPAYKAKTICIDKESQNISRHSSHNLKPVASADSLAYVIYTSGSTGNPKGTLLEHSGLCKVSTEQVKYFDAGPGSRVLQFSSPNFDASLFDFCMALTTGGTLVLAKQEELQPGPPLLKLLRDQHISILTIPPSSLATMSPVALPDLKVINVAGEACSAELVARWAPGRRFFNLYGPTECTIWTTANECVNDGNTPHIGQPIGNTRVYVLDRYAQPVPVGVPGELYIGGVGIARGYLNLPEKTAEKFVADTFGEEQSGRLYRTGDKVRFRDDGTMEFVGRIDHQVKLRGFRIEPGEIEAVLSKQPGVESAVVIVREDEPGEKRLVAYLVPASSSAAPATNKLRTTLQETLPAHMVPSVIVYLDELPLTPNGKIDTKALPKPDIERQAEVIYAAPQNDFESKIVDIWREVLNLEKVGIDDNFFDLGGHSLLLVQLQKKISEKTGNDLPIVTFFQFPTIRSLAEHIREPDQEENESLSSGQPQSGSKIHEYEPIAVIGMAGRFPGASDLDEFWHNLSTGVESIRFFNDEELSAAGIDASVISDPNYVPAKGFLENADLFDAHFFGYSPREAELIDPQQRVFLECSWEALECAGYDPERYSKQIGVFAGQSMNTYQFGLYTHPKFQTVSSSMQGVIGSDKDFLPTRVSYKFNLRGPSVNIQTACSTSLVAVHEACRCLHANECDIALAGGVSVSAPLITGYAYESDSILSPDGHCRTFDVNAQGTLAGDGAGVVVLKKLSEAQADGDNILAVIRGSAINNDGSDKIGYTAPSVNGQKDAISKALRSSGVDPATVSYVETHGTGTKLGDPIEIAALKQSYKGNENAGKSIALGAVKTNIGHLDAAAGVAGLIKTILSLKHEALPSSLNFSKPNPELHIEDSPFYINSEFKEWPKGETVRRAGVSSFGIGGTNAHVILEEAPDAIVSDYSRTNQLLVLSARTTEALHASAARLANSLKLHPGFNLADVAFTLQTGRKRFEQCYTFACQDNEEAVKALENIDPSRIYDSNDKSTSRSVAFMFSGQGSQYVNMLKDLYETESCFKDIVDSCCEKLLPELGVDLREIIYPENITEDSATSEKLKQTQYAQPALFIVEYALANLLMLWGIQPAAMIGHSIGEYVAACLAGVMSRDDALTLIAVRARLMGSLPAGKMLSVPLAPDQLTSVLNDQVSLALVNSPTMSVLSGPETAIEQARKQLAEQGIEASLLHTSHAFHSVMMEPVLDEFRKAFDGITLQAPARPYISNVTGDWITPQQATSADYYVQHLRHTVQFSKGIEQLAEQKGLIMLEVGPGQALTGLAKSHLEKSRKQQVLSSTRHPKQSYSDGVFLLETVGQLWASGIAIEWEKVHAPDRPRKVSLPTYPFERQRFWIDPEKSDRITQTDAHRKTNPSEWTYLPSWSRVPVPATETQQLARNWLCFHDQCGLGTQLEKELNKRGCNVVSVTTGDAFSSTGENEYSIDPLKREHYDKLLGELQQNSALPEVIVHLWSVTPENIKQFNEKSRHKPEELGFFSLINLIQALDKINASESLKLAVVTNQVHEITGSETILAEKAMAMAPCKTISMEYPNINARSIDVALIDSNHTSDYLARLLTQDLCAPWIDPVVAYRGRYRWKQTYQPVTLPEQQLKPEGLKSSGVYLIVGGLGGLGLVIAEYLARAVSAKLVLVGLTEIPDKEAWSDWLSTHDDHDKVSRKIRMLQRLESLGASVLPCAADVANQQQMTNVVLSAEDTFGKIDGVIHAAGAEKQPVPVNLLEQKDYTKQFLPKLEGLRVLEQVLQGRDLDFCIINSSLASVMGVLNFVTYTASHLYMDAFVYQHNKHSDTPWITVNWDNWNIADTDPGENTYSENKFRMESAEGLDVFGRLLSLTDVSQVLVSTGDVQARIDKLVQANQVEQDSISEEETSQLAAHPRPAMATEYVAPTNDTERILTEIWQNILGIEAVGIHDNFFDLGGDSVISIQIIASARKAGISLTPKQTFDHQTIAELAAVCGSADNAAQIDEPKLDSAPLTPIQSWFFTQQFDDAHHFNQATIIDVPEKMQQDLLRQAVVELMKHHENINTRYRGEYPNLRQITKTEVSEVPFEWFDLTDLDKKTQQAELEAQANRLQRSFNLEDGPVFCIAYFENGNNNNDQLLLIFHHLIMDAISMRIVIEDLETAYGQIKQGKQVELPPKTTSFSWWAQKLYEYAQSSPVEQELSYWSEISNKTVATIPEDMEEGENTMATADSVILELDTSLTRSLLQEAQHAYKTQINDLLLTALAWVFEKWTGQRDLLIDMEGHGRDAPIDNVDISRTVGWFTSVYPVLLELPETDDVGSKIRAIKEQLRRIPNNGLNFGVLRYLNSREDIRHQLMEIPDPQIVFLYLGRFDYGLTSDWGATGLERSEKSQRGQLMEVTTLITNDRLRLMWRYSRSRHKPATIERLAKDYMQALTDIINHCTTTQTYGFTPSDFPAARVDQSVLDKLAASINKK